MQNQPLSTIRRRTLLGGALAVAGMAFAGCSDTQAPTGKPGGTNGAGSGRTSLLTIGSPTDIDPKTLIRFRAPNQPLRRTVYDYLLEKKDGGGYIPGLASKWEWNSDYTVVKITLRDDVTYHDGRKFTADDLVGVLEIATKPDSGSQAGRMISYLSKSIVKSGDHEVTCTMSKPFPAFLDAFSALPIVDPLSFEDIASGAKLNGTGPYVFKKWTAGTSVELEVNKDYWDGMPSVDNILVKVIPDPSAMLAAMRAGDLDIALRMLARDAATFKEDPGYSVTQSKGYEIYVGCNTVVKPFDDPRVRQAVAFSLDRERIASQVYSGFAQPGCTSWPAGTPGITQEMVDRYKYNLDKARDLLKQAGYSGLEVGITHNSSEPTYKANQDIVQYGLEEAGFKVKVVALDPTQFVQALQGAQLLGVWTTDVALTALGVIPSLLTANPLLPLKNTHNYTNPEYAALIDALVAADDAARPAATAALMNHLQDSAHHNTLVQAATPLVTKANVSGLTLDYTLALQVAKVKVTA